MYEPYSSYSVAIRPSCWEGVIISDDGDVIFYCAQNEHVLFHYNGHGVPKPTQNGEIWVFNKVRIFYRTVGTCIDDHTPQSYRTTRSTFPSQSMTFSTGWAAPPFMSMIALKLVSLSPIIQHNTILLFICVSLCQGLVLESFNTFARQRDSEAISEVSLPSPSLSLS